MLHIVRPDGDGPFPVVVFFHHGPGLDDPSKRTMQLIADAPRAIAAASSFFCAVCTVPLSVTHPSLPIVTTTFSNPGFACSAVSTERATI